jgi:plastocyanin
MVTVLVMGLTFAGSSADAPIPEAGVLDPAAASVVAGPCTAENAFDAAYPGDLADPVKSAKLQPPQVATARTSAAYESCSRLKVVIGPILMKPGQNDVLIQPVTFEKPLYDGYIVRFKPDMVGPTGESPRVKDAHLHHGTWLNAGRSYGSGPWIATGEEKTTVVWPSGFGLKVLSDDTWLFLHMIHNATAETSPVWVTYDIDYVPADAAEADSDGDGVADILNTKSIWLDVGDCSWHDECVKDTLNPIFNVQRGFNAAWDADKHALDNACIFPRENCANINTLAETSAQQGVPVGEIYDEFRVREDGTLVLMGGHLHNGGLRDDVYLVRDLNGDGVYGGSTQREEERLIHKSDAYYFDHSIDWDSEWNAESVWDPKASKIGAPPVSWDFVMTGVTADYDWKVNVREGDRIRLEGIYDSTIASWYEQMGIVMTWMVPATDIGGQFLGVDPFDPSVEIHEGYNADVVQPGTIPGYQLPGTEHGACSNTATRLCVRGQMTHARIPTSGDHWGCANCAPIARNAVDGQVMSDIAIGGFGYGAADIGVIGAAGIPIVPLGETVTFWNADTADYMWHTITRCANPCTGTTSASYPLADGSYDDLLDPDTGVDAQGRSVDQILAQEGPDPMDFDSGQIGYGTGANNKLEWEFTPTREGTYTFYCRIHPPMRGAIRVVDMDA